TWRADRGCSAIGLHLLIEPVTRPLASWNVVTPLLSVRVLPVTRPAASRKRRSWAWAGAGVASVVKSAMVMVRMADFIVRVLGMAPSNLIDHFLDTVFLTLAFHPI